MNFRRTLKAVVLLANLSLASCSTTPPATELQVEVRAAHDRLVLAFNTCNEAAFTSSYAEGFTFITSNTKTTITTLVALRGYLAAGCRQTPTPHVTLTSQSIKLAGQLTISTGQYTFRIASGDGVTDVKQNYTLAMQHTAEGWRVSAHHVSVAP